MIIQKFKVDVNTDNASKELFIILTGKDYNEIKKQLDKFHKQTAEKLSDLNPKIRFHNVDLNLEVTKDLIK